MKRHVFVLCAVIALLALVSTTALAATTPKSSNPAAPLSAPGVLETTFKINVVFVGYEEADIDLPKFEAELPTTYDPLVILPYTYYGITLPLNIHGDYDFNYVFAPTNFEDAFFGHLLSAASAGDLTRFQRLYNTQVHKTLTVEPDVLRIDAPSTERWLMDHGRADLGLDVANYTVFFVNWYSRPDFRFHVYTKTDDPDTDTHHNFGISSSRAMIAWGGTYGRTWFYDLSAGPEAWTNNWNVDDPDVDEDGEFDYRMPPIWEYGNLTGYRPFDNLSGDLGKVLRWTAIDALFTTSPVYDPLVTEPFPGRGKRVFINLFEDGPGSNGLDWFNKSYILKTLKRFQPQYPWKITLKDQKLGQARRPFRIWAGLNLSDDCWNQYGDVFAELFCFFDDHRSDYLPPIKPLKNHIIGVFAFNTTDERLGAGGGLLGYADDDWVSGTPSYVFEFDTPGARKAGFGFSTTTTHEVGHIIGMDHPHSGYDSTTGISFDAIGEFYFVWSGDESHSIMQYIAVANQFGWFDHDNMNRFLAGRYITRSAEIAAQLRQTETSREANGLMEDADARLSDARNAFRAMDYELAAGEARAGFERVWRSAQLSNLKIPMVEPLAPGVRRNIPRMVDPIRFPND